MLPCQSSGRGGGGSYSARLRDRPATIHWSRGRGWPALVSFALRDRRTRRPGVRQPHCIPSGALRLVKHRISRLDQRRRTLCFCCWKQHRNAHADRRKPRSDPAGGISRLRTAAQRRSAEASAPIASVSGSKVTSSPPRYRAGRSAGRRVRLFIVAAKAFRQASPLGCP